PISTVVSTRPWRRRSRRRRPRAPRWTSASSSSRTGIPRRTTPPTTTPLSGNDHEHHGPLPSTHRTGSTRHVHAGAREPGALHGSDVDLSVHRSRARPHLPVHLLPDGGLLVLLADRVERVQRCQVLRGPGELPGARGGRPVLGRLRAIHDLRARRRPAARGAGPDPGPRAEHRARRQSVDLLPHRLLPPGHGGGIRDRRGPHLRALTQQRAGGPVPRGHRHLGFTGRVPLRSCHRPVERAPAPHLEELRDDADLLAGRAADGAGGVLRGRRGGRCRSRPATHEGHPADPPALRRDHRRAHREREPDAFALIQALTGGGPYYSSEVVEVYIFRTAFAPDSAGGVPRLGYASAAGCFFGVATLVIALLQAWAMKLVADQRARLAR